MSNNKLPFPLLHIDNHVMVVVKPAGLPVQPDDSGDDDLLTICKRYVKVRYDKPGNVYLGLVHRLDRPVSGPLVLARTSKAAGRLSGSFRERSTVKRYVGLVEGRCTGSGVLKDHLLDRDRTVRVVRNGTRGARSAELSWSTVSIVGNRTLVDIDLETGRKHQIRVQLANMGHPVSGDLRYGAAAPFDGRNIALHCYALGFAHPVKKESMIFTVAPEWNIESWVIDRIGDLVSAVAGTGG